MTLCWQAMTATSVAGKHKIFCLNELPYRLSSPLPVIWEFSHLRIHLSTDFCLCPSFFLYFLFERSCYSNFFCSVKQTSHDTPYTVHFHQWLFPFAATPSHKHLLPSVQPVGKQPCENKWPCLFWPTLSGVCNREGPLMHTNPSTQWPQSLKSVNRKADAPD